MDDKVVDFPNISAQVAAANRAAARVGGLGGVTPLDIANAALREAAESIETLARIAQNSPELLPLLRFEHQLGGTNGVVGTLVHIGELLNAVYRIAERQCSEPWKKPYPTERNRP
jgi:hypothetical protein